MDKDRTALDAAQSRIKYLLNLIKEMERSNKMLRNRYNCQLKKHDSDIEVYRNIIAAQLNVINSFEEKK